MRPFTKLSGTWFTVVDGPSGTATAHTGKKGGSNDPNPRYL